MSKKCSFCGRYESEVEKLIVGEIDGEINENSEVFVLKEEDQVMSEPALFTDNDKDLILKYSYQNEVLIS